MKKAHKWTPARRAARIAAKEISEATELMDRIAAFDPVLRAATGLKCKNWLDEWINFRLVKAQFIHSYGELTYGEFHAMRAALNRDLTSHDFCRHLDLTTRTHRLLENNRRRRKITNLMPMYGLDGWSVVDVNADPNVAPYQNLAVLPITFDVLRQQADDGWPC